MRFLLSAPVRIYQFFSSVFAPRCKYYPSCSNYAITAIRRYGVKGIAMATWRILRCNPWSQGGVDYVDENLDCADARKASTKELVGAI
jgi:putative membrane protein insertion efficiency factor